ncbi:hypothetical protein M2263_002142 [Providencia alcalifaciens]|nr:hypothetical protein [Providencia alcalifaciens]
MAEFRSIFCEFLSALCLSRKVYVHRIKLCNKICILPIIYNTLIFKDKNDFLLKNLKNEAFSIKPPKYNAINVLFF